MATTVRHRENGRRDGEEITDIDVTWMEKGGVDMSPHHAMHAFAKKWKYSYS
jgi:hypothetical protein